MNSVSLLVDPAHAVNPNPWPLVVDLDGTLLCTDTLVEAVVVLLRRRPWMLFALLLWAFTGPLRLKNRLAALVQPDLSLLPIRADLLAWLVREHKTGRSVVLATAAQARIAQAAAAHFATHGLVFDQVLSSSDCVNLKGAAKLQAIREAVGPTFTYAGDGAADLPIWAASTAVVTAGASASVLASLPSHLAVEAAFEDAPRGLRVWLEALRVHQWVKNLLVFVPVFTALAFADARGLRLAMVAFFAFSLAASGTYLLNDIWDLDNDRRHPRKCLRALACGRISLIRGALVAGLLLAAGVALATANSVALGWMVVGYVFLSTAYSLILKTYVLIDVLTLAGLYTYRVLAGGVAAGITVSPWLLAFSVFTFFSLALVKRCAELVAAQSQGQKAASGRDYRVADLVVLWPLGVAASICATVVFCLYAASPETTTRFANPQALWPVAAGLIYWFGRLWVKTARGEMHDDPLVFALRDRSSRIVVTGIGMLYGAAFLSLP